MDREYCFDMLDRNPMLSYNDGPNSRIDKLGVGNIVNP